MICATCRHTPGAGLMCARGGRHATAHPKRCPAFAGSRDAKHCKRVTQLSQLVDSPKQGVVDPKTGLVPESDIYRLVMRSRLSAAERFEEWVVGEVLPTLRRTGSYEVRPQEPAEAVRE